MTLHTDHPDAKNNPGDEFVLAQGDIWVFGRNQFTSFWRAKPKDGSVLCSKDYPDSEFPYLAGGRLHKTLDKAIVAARSAAKLEYERAKAIVNRYEADA